MKELAREVRSLIDEGRILDFLISVADNTGVIEATDTCSPLDTLVLTTGLGRGYFLSGWNIQTFRRTLRYRFEPVLLPDGRELYDSCVDHRDYRKRTWPQIVGTLHPQSEQSPEA